MSSLRERWGSVIGRQGRVADWNWFGFPQREDLKNQLSYLKNSVSYLSGMVRGGSPDLIISALVGVVSQVENVLTVFWVPDRPGFREADKAMKNLTKGQQALIDLQRALKKSK